MHGFSSGHLFCLLSQNCYSDIYYCLYISTNIHMQDKSKSKLLKLRIWTIADVDKHLSDLAPMNHSDVSGQTIKWNMTSLLNTFSSENCQRESGTGQVSLLPRVSLLIL